MQGCGEPQADSEQVVERRLHQGQRADLLGHTEYARAADARHTSRLGRPPSRQIVDEKDKPVLMREDDRLGLAQILRSWPAGRPRVCHGALARATSRRTQ